MVKYRLSIKMQDGKEYYVIEEKRKFLGVITIWVHITVGQDHEKVKNLFETEYKPLNK